MPWLLQSVLRVCPLTTSVKVVECCVLLSLGTCPVGVRAQTHAEVRSTILKVAENLGTHPAAASLCRPQLVVSLRVFELSLKCLEVVHEPEAKEMKGRDGGLYGSNANVAPV